MLLRKIWDFHTDGNCQWHFLIFLGLRWPIRSYIKHSNIYVFWHLVTLKANWTGRTVPLVTSLPSSCYMTQNYSRDFCRPGRPTTVPDDIRAQEVDSKCFWRENWWLVAFGYSVCCRVSNVTKAQSVNMNPPQSSWCTLFSSPWTFTTVQCFGLPAVSRFLDSHMLLSSLSTPTLILASTLLSAMSKQSP